MRAVVVKAAGGPEAVQIVETARPEPAAGQVRIKVAATALNPVDEAVRAGFFGPVGDGAGLGWDIAGTVDAVGAGAGAVWGVGDRVVALHHGAVKALGAHAEYAVVDASAVAAAPASVDAAAAAALPLNALTADQALDLLGLERGRSVLVTGAAGAVGGFAVQLAAGRGLEVTGLAREADEELVRSLGAAHFTAGAVRPASVDGVLDAAVLGGAALEWVRDGGVYVGVRPGAHPAGVRGIRTAAVGVTADGARLAGLVRLVDEGALRLRVAESFPLADSAKAHARRGEGGVRGALVLVP
ncbi:zinc-binding dehydrogenase [Streptomyces mangrovisoli]|uniref:NADPH:quinone reductase n=1 Tax=Streptomyces mangrovisoli TaxID=1428628 RepID=A0A1J4P007_9ACTN|nr:zinc-binding dehydrogenase [Streptomyces mangrovisoli]OIJ66750.1 NADPH:quinone reductase [Streptomyces mangrovisoli]